MTDVFHTISVCKPSLIVEQVILSKFPSFWTLQPFRFISSSAGNSKEINWFHQLISLVLNVAVTNLYLKCVAFPTAMWLTGVCLYSILWVHCSFCVKYYCSVSRMNEWMNCKIRSFQSDSACLSLVHQPTDGLSKCLEQMIDVRLSQHKHSQCFQLWTIRPGGAQTALLFNYFSAPSWVALAECGDRYRSALTRCLLASPAGAFAKFGPSVELNVSYQHFLFYCSKLCLSRFKWLLWKTIINKCSSFFNYFQIWFQNKIRHRFRITARKL